MAGILPRMLRLQSALEAVLATAAPQRALLCHATVSAALAALRAFRALTADDIHADAAAAAASGHLPPYGALDLAGQLARVTGVVAAHIDHLDRKVRDREGEAEDSDDDDEKTEDIDVVALMRLRGALASLERAAFRSFRRLLRNATPVQAQHDDAALRDLMHISEKARAGRLLLLAVRRRKDWSLRISPMPCHVGLIGMK